MDSKRRYPWMRHAAAEDNELENKSDVWKVTTHTHTHTHTCELPESAHRTNTTHIKVLLQAVDLLLSVIWWKGDVQPGCTAMEGEAQGPSRANPEQQVHHPGRKGLALCCTG